MMIKNNSKNSSQSPKQTKKPKKIEAKSHVDPSNSDRGLVVVGIGASAGGLEALRSFFQALPSDMGTAFVVITHLHPEYESHMAELLQRNTRMPVMQVTTKTKMEADHVYVITPNRSMLMTNTHLDTREFDEPHGRRTPIDHFFRSMAASGHSDPIAIILSGGGTDGSVGIKDVKEVGGLIMVQQPEDAQYDSMPRAALTTGLVDVVLPADGLAEKLADYIQHRPQLPHDPGQLSEAEAETLRRILGQVYARTGNDFSQYKRSTILRRIERRMQLNGFATLDAYLAYLRGNVNEVQAIFNDMLIGVTNFFRDRDSWLALQQEVIPGLFNDGEYNERDGIRVWSIGCATGEEAYGIAILLFEEAARRDVRTRIQIFASDLDEKSIAQAREGLYPEAIEADVSPERLERFFMREGEYYRVKRELRDVVLFTNHNVMRDPPFSRQNLIACRNVLIYLERSVQDRIFDIFHYALNPGGYLFLGASESVEHLPDLFSVVDKDHRIFQTKLWSGERPHVPSLPFALRRTSHSQDPYALGRSRSTAHYTDEPAILEEQHQKALEQYGPPSIVINERSAILHVSETAGRYLLQPKGPVTGDLLKLIRPELQLELRTALFRAFEKNAATLSRPVFVQFNGHPHRVVLAIRPNTDNARKSDWQDRQALVVFLEDELDESLDLKESDSLIPRNETERDQIIARLEADVQRLREQLQITIEEYDSSNEEMKASNEELQSINEEYRSATEELETSKEELQSVNEELQTVNNDLRNKLEELARAHAELENLLGATEIGILFLDRELRIQRFTAGTNDLFNIMPSDRGRPIRHLTHKMKYQQLTEDAEQVLRTLTAVEHEVQTENGDWYLLRMRAYRTTEDKIQGVVMSFVDINKLKEAEQEIVRAKETLEEHVVDRTKELNDANQRIRYTRDLFFNLFHSNPIPTALTRLEDGMLMDANSAYLEYFGLEREAAIGHSKDELHEWADEKVRSGLIAQIRKKGMVQNKEVDMRTQSGEIKRTLISVQRTDMDGVESAIWTFIDVSERVRAEQQIRSLAYDLTRAEQLERRRISQILHDDLQQRIFAVKMQISTLYDAYRQGNLQSAQVDFAQLQEWLDQSISITRNLSIDLSPAILKGEGLADALVWLAAQMKDQYGLQVTLQSNGIAARYEDSLRILLFQAVREILFNIVKHADTREATITMESVDDHTRLTISDEGVGFDAQAILEGSKTAGGLLNLQHRLNLMGCNLQAKSQPSVKGTQMIIDIPSDK